MPFNEFLKRLLGWEPNLPTCRKLTRSASYQAAYQKWLESQSYLPWTTAFHKAYHYQKANLTSHLRVQLITGDNRQGAVFFYDPAISPEAFSFLFDYLKDRVLEQNYILHNMDQHDVRHERYTKQTEKYFLLPPASDVPGSDLCNQLYGNITLDYTRVNRHPGYIRLLTNAYADPYFSTPLLFTDLLDKILLPDGQPRI
ncbi:hypothetical protein [Pontibacter chitinilyticus]|uniref:hypothetical protein n=1 Tax=Pontibacter chitinilyticus TaxID=2674989 RepID=UPI00321C0226